MRLSPKYLEQIGILSQVESKWQYSFLWIMDPENECTFRLDSFLLLCSLLTGVVLIFFVIAHTVLWFGFVMKIVLITH